MLKKLREFIVANKYKILAVISIGAAFYYFSEYINDNSRIKLSSFLDALKNNQLSQVIVKGDSVVFRSALSQWYYASIAGFPSSVLFALLRDAKGLSFSVEPQTEQSTLNLLITTPILGASLYFLYQKLQVSQPFTVKTHNSLHLNSFEDFYGGEKIKQKMSEIIQYISHPEKFAAMGARVRRGVLFYGPPGTGKTLLARAMAHEANMAFIGVCASQFDEIYIGVGPKRIRQIFQCARKHKEGCIIFIDQLDAIGCRRQKFSVKSDTSLTVNQLLTEMDGFDQNSNIIVIGATNRIQLIDGAIMRSGRFDLKFKLHLPNAEERQGILKTLLIRKKVPNKITGEKTSEIAEKLENWSGADIECLINQSIFNAIKRGDKFVINEDIDTCTQQMILSKLQTRKQLIQPNY